MAEFTANVSGKLPWKAEDKTVCFKQIQGYENLFKLPRPDGLMLEFGVSGGGTLNKFAGLIHPQKIYGFDSFKGLPEAWAHYKVGELAVDHTKITLQPNAELVVGMFQDTLDGFLAEHPEKIAYVHLDADLYSSTKYVLDRIADRLVLNSILHFDEIRIFDCCDHEMRAFEEYMEKSNTKWQILGQISNFDGVFRLVG